MPHLTCTAESPVDTPTLAKQGNIINPTSPDATMILPAPRPMRRGQKD